MSITRGRAPRVLLVEDEVLISMMIEDAMIARGFEVLTATNAGDALQALSEGEQVDVLFTDINIEGDVMTLTINGIAAIYYRVEPVQQ